MPSIFDDPEIAAALAAAGAVQTHPPVDVSMASRRKQREARRPGQPKLSQSDRSLLHAFDRWLRTQPEIAAPTPDEESDMFAELLKAARHQGFLLRTPAGVDDLASLLLVDDENEDVETDGAVAAALATLHDYVHFRLETGDDATGWEEVHDLFDDPLPGGEILEAAFADTEQLAVEERQAALVGTPLVAKVAELLDWIGAGRAVAPSGGVRRADIAHAAGLLGIAAVGVRSAPPHGIDTPALIELDPDPSPPQAFRARSMKDVPLLPSWWAALAASGLIEVRGSRVRPGPAAAEWTAEPLPPVELAEVVVGMTVYEFLGETLENRPALFADQVLAQIIARLLLCLDGRSPGPSLTEGGFEELLAGTATSTLQRLQSVALLAVDADGEFVVPRPLRGAVARGVLATVAELGGAFEAD